MDRFRELAVVHKLPFVATIAHVIGYGLSQVDLRIRSLQSILDDRERQDLPKSYCRTQHERVFLIGKVTNPEDPMLEKVGDDTLNRGVFLLDSETGALFFVSVPEQYSHVGALEFASERIDAEYALFCIYGSWDLAPLDDMFAIALRRLRAAAANELDDELDRATQATWRL